MPNLYEIENKMTFGKYAGKPWDEVPTSYLLWLKGKMQAKIITKKKTGKNFNIWGIGRLYPKIVLR